MIVATLALTALLCLTVKSTRLIGVVCLALLYCLFPVMFTVVLVIAACILYLYHKTDYLNFIRI